MNSLLADSKRDNDKVKEEVKNLKEEINNHKEKLQESKNIIESNNQLITFLNQQLNENAPYRNFSTLTKPTTMGNTGGIGAFGKTGMSGMSGMSGMGNTNNNIGMGYNKSAISVNDIGVSNSTQTQNSQQSETFINNKYGNSNTNKFSEQVNQKNQITSNKVNLLL